MSFQTGTATDYIDLLKKLDTFLTAQGMCGSPSYAGTGNGTISGLIGGASSVAELITITASDPTHFDVVGSVTGAIGTATVGVAFVSSQICFTITAGGTPFQAGDAFTVGTTPKWERKMGVANVALASQSAYSLDNVVDRLFDGDVLTMFQGSGTTGWIEIDLVASKTIASYNIVGNLAATARNPKNWTFEYWNGASWSVADTRANETFTIGQKKTYAIGVPPTATKFRLNVSANNGDASYLAFSKLEVIESGTGTNVALGTCGTGYIWKAPGSDGASSIFVGAKTFYNTTGDYFNWRLAGFSAFDAAVSWNKQAGYTGTSGSDVNIPVLKLWNSNIPYWFVANGRRAMIVAKVSTVYTMGYLGLIDPYMSPNAFPYPLLIGGSFGKLTEAAPTSTEWRWSDTGGYSSNFPWGALVASDVNAADSPLRFRDAVGAWLGSNVYFGNSSAASVLQIFPTGMSASASTCGLGDVRPNLDGSHVLLPLVLTKVTPNVFGEMDGVAWTGGNGNAAENTITVGLSTWLVVPNVFRSGNIYYCAVKLS